MAELARMWKQWQRRRAEQRQWADAPDFASLRELTARWCLGELSWSAVGQPAPRDPETEFIGDALAAINRAGLLTTHSQPAQEVRQFNGSQTVQARAFVEGYATPETEEQFRRLIVGTRLQIATQMDARWWTSYKGAAPAFRFIYANTVNESEGQFGAKLSAEAMGLEFHGCVPGHILDQINEMPRITVWDPQWRPSDLLWRRLATDWERPPPLTDEDRAPADAVPSDAEVERLSTAMDEAFAERDLWWDLWQKSGLDSDEAAMDAADRRADYLLTLYNVAVTAQYAEVGHRRAENLARYAAEQQAVADGAREWLSELQFADVDPEDFDDHDFITDQEVLRAADKAYDGGLNGLIHDLELDLPSAPSDGNKPDNAPREQA